MIPRWRCPIHDRLNDPAVPGCGCPHPLDAMKLQDDAELQRYRAQRSQEDIRMAGRSFHPVSPGDRGRRHNWAAIQAAEGRLTDIAARFGMSRQQAYNIRRAATGWRPAPRS